MATVSELLDIVEERVIEEPPGVSLIANVEIEFDKNEDDEVKVAHEYFESEEEVNDVEPPPS